MNELFESARVVAHQYLNFEKNHLKKKVNLELIQSIISKKVCTVEYYENIDQTELAEILMSDFSVGKGSISVLSEEITPWLNDIRGGLTWQLWKRYQMFMGIKDATFPINDLDDFTDKILDKCQNPLKQGAWDRRGMVVGHVQSGKTSNYVGLINKAVDAGYKLIIIIAGTMNSLRRQTQERVDEGFVGIHSAKGTIIGVGDFKTPITIYPLTSSTIKPDGDFDQKTATRKGIPIGNNPVVLVIKKNKGILENLIDWLASNSNTKLIEGEPKLCNVPTLVIDDEADSASINTISSKKVDKAIALEELKTINKLIRTLLNLFEKNTFIGYTATPYANLFIPQEWSETKEAIVKGKKYKVGEDLFPRDFIINIRAPQNYIGAGKFFGLENPVTGIATEPLNIFRSIDDFDPPFYETLNKNNNDDLPEYLPQSLKTAIKSFIITAATRRLRGHEKKHNSMLIHVALYIKWIDKVAKLVNDELKTYKSYINGSDAVFLKELQDLYEEDFLPTTTEIIETLDYDDPRIKVHNWKDVEKEIKKAAPKIEVRAVHGEKSISNLEYSGIEEIDYSLYSEGLSVIAVGGTRLARGITLEGLSISYYLRTTKMYDSLMQMGRWFGYRPGYVDLCRLFTTIQIYEWFNHITMATEEMRYDFDEMTALLQRPKDFRLKVRNHHGLLAITSVSKLFWAQEITISFSGQNPQTYQLLKTDVAITNNFKALERLVLKMGFPPLIDRVEANNKIKYLLYRNADVNEICEFLDSYKIDQPSIKNATLSDYIKQQANEGKISNWNVALVSNTDNDVFIDLTGDTPINARNKNFLVKQYCLSANGEAATLGCVIRNQKKETRSSGYYFISKNQIDDIKDRQVDLAISGASQNDVIKNQRALEKKGLLLIYALDPRCTPNVDTNTPIIGFSIHFPRIENETPVRYTTTTNSELEQDLMDDDDDDITD
jgi:hypothetical protein